MQTPQRSHPLGTRPLPPIGEAAAREAVAKYLKANPLSYTYQVAPAVHMTEAATRKLLHAMERDGIVRQDEPDCWVLAR